MARGQKGPKKSPRAHPPWTQELRPGRGRLILTVVMLGMGVPCRVGSRRPRPKDPQRQGVNPPPHLPKI